MEQEIIERFGAWLNKRLAKGTSLHYMARLKNTPDFTLTMDYDVIFKILSQSVTTTVSRAAHMKFIKFLKDTTFNRDEKMHASVIMEDLKELDIRKSKNTLSIDEVRYKVLTKDEVSRLYSAVNDLKKPKVDRIQDLLLLRFLYETAGRAEEVRRYEWSMINIDEQKVEVPKSITKGNVYRTAEFSIKTKELLITYKTYLCKNHITQRRLFYNYKNYHMLYNFMIRFSKRVINKRVTMHWFRHSFATHKTIDALNIGESRIIVEEKIRQYLGHDDIKTTRIYTKLADTLKHERLLEQYGEVP